MERKNLQRAIEVDKALQNIEQENTSLGQVQNEVDKLEVNKVTGHLGVRFCVGDVSKWLELDKESIYVLISNQSKSNREKEIELLKELKTL